MIPYRQAKKLTFQEVGGTDLTYQGIFIKTMPDTIEYSIGELLSFDGLEIYATYQGDDIYYKDVTDSVTPSVAEGTPVTADMSVITFTYQGDTVSYQIEVKSLPEGFTEKLYIKHTASGELKLTDMSYQDGYVYHFDIAVPGASNATSSMFEIYSVVGRNNARIRLDSLFNTSRTKFQNVRVLGSKDGTTVGSVQIPTEEPISRCMMIFDAKNGTLSINGTVSDISAATAVLQQLEFDGASSRVGAIIGTQTYYNYMEVYGIKVYSDGTLIHDYIPCTNNNNVPGLYNSKTRQFIYSTAWDVAG